MSASNFNLRNIAPDLMQLLKKEALAQKVSVNSLILEIIEQNLGFTKKIKKNKFHDLDYLAGTWNEKDKKEFDENTTAFEQIDKDLWL